NTADVDPAEILVHDAHNPDTATAFALTRLSDPETLHHTPIGVLRDVSRSSYDKLMNDQLERAEADGMGDLDELLAGVDTWTVE
ncbi:MAG: 2-oxoacid:ferredoxin oxidoreductase subunit beta, partial [Candidatus Nanopelagicales bacterium]